MIRKRNLKFGDLLFSAYTMLVIRDRQGMFTFSLLRTFLGIITWVIHSHLQIYCHSLGVDRLQYVSSPKASVAVDEIFLYTLQVCD